MGTGTAPKRQPGSLLLSPYPLIAIAVVLLNDNIGKRYWPGVVTGKLSDVAGAFLVPVLAVSIIEGLTWAARRPRILGTRTITAVCAVSAAGLVVTKTSRWGARAYGSEVGWLRFLVTGSYHRVAVTVDPTDLLALGAVFLAWLYARSGSNPALESFSYWKLRRSA